MITKFDEWDNETQMFVKNSIYHSTDKQGYVIDNVMSKRINEDHVFDLIELYKSNGSTDMDIDSVLDVLKNRMPDMNYIQHFAINSAIWYLEHHQMD